MLPDSHELPLCESDLYHVPEWEGTIFEREIITFNFTESDAFPMIKNLDEQDLMTPKRKVLLVDDDPDEIDLLSDAFSELSSVTMCYGAENGRVALTMLNSWPGELPDVILLDINMPIMNGWEFLKNVKQSERLKDIPVIIYSTSGREPERQMASELGAARFIKKPNNFRILKKELESLLLFIRSLLSFIWPGQLQLGAALMINPRLLNYERTAVLLLGAGKRMSRPGLRCSLPE